MRYLTTSPSSPLSAAPRGFLRGLEFPGGPLRARVRFLVARTASWVGDGAWFARWAGPKGATVGFRGPLPQPPGLDTPVLPTDLCYAEGAVALAPPLSYRSGAIDLVSPPFSMFGWFPLLPFGGGPLARCAATTLRLWFGFRAVVALRGGS